jgi:hypothetical protein
MKVWHEGHWFEDIACHMWRYVKPGEYEAGVSLPDDACSHAVTFTEMKILIECLDGSGWLRPRLDDKARQDDLKVVHRLIDLLEKQ